MRPDIVASFKITVTDLSAFDPAYLAEDARMIQGVRDAAVVDILDENAFALDVRFHGQTEQARAEGVAQRIFGMLNRDSNLEHVQYSGLLGHEEPPAGIDWTGRDPFDEITSKHDGHAWVRADYFVHALSYEDLGIRDVNFEHMVIQALQNWPQRVQAREAVRRHREMYALLEEVRDLANMQVELDPLVGALETDTDVAVAPPSDAPVAAS